MFDLFTDGETVATPLQEILAAAAVTHRARTPEFRPGPDAEILLWITRKEARKALELQAHLVDVRDGRPPEDVSKDADLYNRETTSETDRRRAKMKALGWSASTMSRREKAYRERGFAGLIAHSARKSQLKNAIDVPPEILRASRLFCEGRSRSSKKAKLSEHAALIAYLRRLGLVSRTPGTPGADGIELPTVEDVMPYHRFAALLHQLERGLTSSTAKTRHEQSKRPTRSSPGHRGYDFGDMVEMDSTPTDFFVRGPDGEQRRAYAVFAVCVSTRMMWLRLVSEPPRGRDLALLLFDIVGGRSLVQADLQSQIGAVPGHLRLKEFPPHATPPQGLLPGAIRLDHGAEEENKYWISICAQLSIEIHWAATMTPTDKAYVESLISTFARICELVPSHKGNTVVNRPQFINVRDTPTFEEAEEAFRHWPVWAANQPHSGLQVGTSNRFLTPMQAVQTSLSFGNQMGLLADPTLAVRLLPSVHLSPIGGVVTWQKRPYVCKDFKVLEDVANSRGERRKLVFFYDPQAKHRLYWIEPGTFNVRRLSSPGADSGVQAAFGSVRRAIADTLGYNGQEWQTHTERAQRRADLLEMMQESWSSDALDPDANVANHRPTSTRSRSKRKTPPRETEITNGGWRLEDFDLEAADGVEEADTRWDDGLTGPAAVADDVWDDFEWETQP